MNWIGWLILGVVIVVLLVLRKAGQISASEAREMLQSGAAVVDVRTTDEFSNGHLPKAINIPLDEIETALPRRFPNRDTAILLHCQSGMRSGVARNKLRALGYAKVFNLGSYARAAQIVARSQ